jgi:hypothetical protein
MPHACVRLSIERRTRMPRRSLSCSSVSHEGAPFAIATGWTMVATSRAQKHSSVRCDSLSLRSRPVGIVAASLNVAARPVDLCTVWREQTMRRPTETYINTWRVNTVAAAIARTCIRLAMGLAELGRARASVVATREKLRTATGGRSPRRQLKCCDACAQSVIIIVIKLYVPGHVACHSTQHGSVSIARVQAATCARIQARILRPIAHSPAAMRTTPEHG